MRSTPDIIADAMVVLSAGRPAEKLTRAMIWEALLLIPGASAGFSRAPKAILVSRLLAAVFADLPRRTALEALEAMRERNHHRAIVIPFPTKTTIMGDGARSLGQRQA